MLERMIGSGWGSLEISTPAVAYELGDSIDGTVAIRAKRELGPAQLIVAIACVRYDARTLPPLRGGRITHQRSSSEVWRRSVVLDDEVNLLGGTTVEYPFSVALPEPDEDSAVDQIPDWARGTIVVFNTVTFNRAGMQWTLRGRLHHPGGFDLRHNVGVLVNS